jgi:hypothetical protein
MKQVKNQVYLTEGSLPIDPGRTTMLRLWDPGWESDHMMTWVGLIEYDD